MFKHLLIPLDGSRLAESVLPVAAVLAKKLGTTVTLAHLIERDARPEVHGERHLTETGEARRYLAEVAGRFFGPESEVLFHVHEAEVRDVAQGIVDHACEFGCNLIVMCTHGKHGLKQALAGSIAQQVVALGHGPVLLLQPNGRVPAEGLDLILVPLDGNPAHERALPVARDLARGLGASLHLTTVVHTLATMGGAEAATGIMLPGTTQALLEINEAQAIARLEGIARTMQAEGAGTTIAVLRGDPAASIAREAALRQADLIVLGTHGHAGTSAFWSGSVAARLLGMLKLPMLLVPVHES